MDDKFRAQHNQTVLFLLFLQYCKLSRHNDKIVEEQVDRLRIKTTECKYEENDKQVKEHFITGISDDIMTMEIIN